MSIFSFIHLLQPFFVCSLLTLLTPLYATPVPPTNPSSSSPSNVLIEGSLIEESLIEDLLIEDAWRLKHWTQEHGLPQSTVTAIAPASDGRLFIGTFAGLSLFDGQNFDLINLFPNETRIFRVTALASETHFGQGLWIGTEREGLWYLKGDQLIHHPLPQDRGKLTVYQITLGYNKDVWLATDQGVFLKKDQRDWKRVYKRTTFDVDPTPDGSAWLCSIERVEFLSSDGTTRSMIPIEQRTEHDMCRGGMLSPDGHYWALFEDRLLLMSEDEVIPVFIEWVWGDWMQSPLLDSRGQLWLPVKDAILELGDINELVQTIQRGHVISPTSHPTPGQVRRLYTNKDGILWAGMTGTGLMRLTSMGFTQISWPNEDIGQGIGPLTGSDDEVWFTHQCDHLFKIKEKNYHHPKLISLPPPSAGTCIDALGVDQRGRLFVARENEILQLMEGRVIQKWSLTSLNPPNSHHQIDDQNNHRVSAITPAQNQGVWIGTREGRLFYISPQGDLQLIPTPDVLIGCDILSILDEDDENLVIGHSEGVSIRYMSDDYQGGWRHFTSKEGLAAGSARDIVRDEKGVLWIATYGGGLGWIEGDKAGQISDRNNTLNDTFLSSVLLSSTGDVWLQGNKGVTQVQLSDLWLAQHDSNHVIRAHHFNTGEANGWLRSSAALLKSKDLWLSNVDRVIILDTSQPFKHTQLVAPQILNAYMGELQLDPDVESNIIPPHTFRQLRISYMVPHLDLNTKVRYEHRLIRDLSSNNQNTPWISVGTDRLANYTHLPSGDYQFQVRGVSVNGHVGPSTNMNIRISPTWSEDLGVQGGLFGLGIGIALLIGLGRARVTERQNQVLQNEIDQRKAIEAQLADREAHYRQVFDQAANAFLLYDEDGNCMEVNPEACQLFRGSREALLAIPASLLGLSSFDHLRRKEVQSSAPFLCARLDETLFPARVVYAPCTLPHGEGHLFSVMDLSMLVNAQETQVRLQQQLGVARRMESLGRFAGGLAHDMNNILGVLRGNLDLIRESIDDQDDYAQECLIDVDESFQKGVDLIQQLLVFSRDRRIELNTVNPVEVLDHLKRMLSCLIKSKQSFKIHSSPCGQIQINKSQFEQLILNLILNASESSSSSGEIHCYIQENQKNEVEIIIKDDRPPISREMIDQIFEPFLTTQEHKLDITLGLATVKEIAEEVGGNLCIRVSDIQLTNHPLTEHGEPQIKVCLPLVQASEELDNNSLLDTTHKFREGSQELLFLVDDNDGLRRALHRQLVNIGYRVEHFGDPLQALRVLISMNTSPALLITDVIMPNMNGRHLIMEARKRHPELPVLFISGYTADVLGDLNTNTLNELLLQKPFSPTDLSQRVSMLIKASLSKNS